jgi:rhamnosyltransferase subunit B
MLGHKVSLISNYCYADMAQHEGLDFEPLDDPEQFKKFLRDSSLLNTPKGFIEYYDRYFLPNAVKEFGMIADRYVPGDTVIVTRSQPALAALLAGEKLRIPVVSVFLAPSFINTIPVFEELFDEVFGEKMNDIRCQLGLAARRPWRYWLASGHTGLGFWPSWFAPVDATWPTSFALTGFILPKADVSNSSRFLPPEFIDLVHKRGRPALITGGTGLFFGSELFSVCVEACRRAAIPAVVVTRHRQQLPAALPEGVLCYEHLPFEQVVPHVRAFIHHGGIGTASQAMAGGVPQIIMGTGSDRPENAGFLKHLGLAEYLPPAQWQPELVAEAITRVTSAELQKRCQEVAATLSAEHGIESACEAISRILTQTTTFEVSAQSVASAALDQAEVSKIPNGELRFMLERLSKDKRVVLEGWLQQRMSTGSRTRV